MRCTCNNQFLGGRFGCSAHRGETEARRRRDHDVELMIDLREVLGRAQAEIARLCVRNRELEGELFRIKANLSKEGGA